ncbi:MAG TPA: S26 family signal peptidase, partial [Sphingopyxis sp.]|nr:S26 family signal peptidase [Sphingopyxis sp.]
MLALIGLAGALAATVVSAPAPRLVWNVSASAPRGLYAVSPAAAIARGDTVIAWVPSEWRRLAALRLYIPINVPLVKRVAAGAGGRVCAGGLELRGDERGGGARR